MKSALPLLLLGVGALYIISSKKKGTSGAFGYDPYSTKAGDGIPADANYRLAVVQGESCLECKYAVNPPEGLYCNYWKTFVGENYVCDSFEA